MPLATMYKVALMLINPTPINMCPPLWLISQMQDVWNHFKHVPESKGTECAGVRGLARARLLLSLLSQKYHKHWVLLHRTAFSCTAPGSAAVHWSVSQSPVCAVAGSSLWAFPLALGQGDVDVDEGEKVYKTGGLYELLWLMWMGVASGSNPSQDSRRWV